MRLLRPLPLLASLLLSLSVHAGQPIVRFCADDAQWPPFSYSSPNGDMSGFTIDMIRQIFANSNDRVQIEQLPWKRCLAATDNGSRFQVAIDASANEERRRKFLLTRSYYQLTPYFFYSRSKFPQGLSVQHGNELASHGTVCGLPGYNYSNFALGNTEVYTGALDFETLAQMIRIGRCDLFIGRYEIVAGLAKVGSKLLDDPDLDYAPIPDAQLEPFHMLISRNLENGRQLKQRIDTAIGQMEKNGQLEQLKQRYQPLPPNQAAP